MTIGGGITIGNSGFTITSADILGSGAAIYQDTTPIGTNGVDGFENTAAQPGGAPCLISDDFSGPFNFTINAASNQLQTGWYTTNWGGQYATNNVPTALTHDGSTWYNITMAVGASQYKDYINGSVSYAPGNFGPGGSAPNGSGSRQQFYIGHRRDNADTVNAKMAVVNIYTRALTDAEVAQNFNYYKSRFGL